MAMAQAGSAPEREELDELTLRRAQRGEPSACRDLVVCYQQQVFAFLSRTLSIARADLVEDVAQETFLAVFRSLPKFTPQGRARLSSWILTIASRRAIDAMRKMPPVHVPLDGAMVAGASSASDSAERSAIAGAIRKALDGLTPEYRAAFVLWTFHDMDYQAIAVALGIEVGTVKSRMARARSRLRASLEELRA